MASGAFLGIDGLPCIDLFRYEIQIGSGDGQRKGGGDRRIDDVPHKAIIPASSTGICRRLAQAKKESWLRRLALKFQNIETGIVIRCIDQPFL